MSEIEVYRDTPPATAARQQSYTLPELESIASHIAKSRMFGIASESQAITLLLMAQSDGIPIMRGIREYHIIDGKPSMRADAMLARYQQAGGRVEWIEWSSTAARALWSHPQWQPTPIEFGYTIQEAQTAGIAGGANWRKSPADMLRARCITKAIRMIAPGIIVGIYSPDEIAEMRSTDMIEAPDPRPRRKAVDAPAPLPQATPETEPVPLASMGRSLAYDTRPIREVIRTEIEALTAAEECASLRGVLTVESVRDEMLEAAREAGLAAVKDTATSYYAAHRTAARNWLAERMERAYREATDGQELEDDHTPEPN